MDEMIEAVKKHARQTADYNGNGWDIVIECYDSSDLEKMIQEAGCTTSQQAIEAVGEVVGIVNDHRKDIEATAF